LEAFQKPQDRILGLPLPYRGTIDDVNFRVFSVYDSDSRKVLKMTISITTGNEASKATKVATVTKAEFTTDQVFAVAGRVPTDRVDGVKILAGFLRSSLDLKLSKQGGTVKTMLQTLKKIQGGELEPMPTSKIAEVIGCPVQQPLFLNCVQYLNSFSQSKLPMPAVSGRGKKSEAVDMVRAIASGKATYAEVEDLDDLLG
jgi:hypothetical protein